MKIRIVCAGKIKEKFYTQAVEEYVKRLGRYAKIEIIQVKDEPTPEDRSPAEERKILDAEGERLLAATEGFDRVYALEILGTEVSSEEFADRIRRDMNTGAGRIAFVIGGSLGLSETVLGRVDDRISFSRMTFPHQLMRVILLEQIYRSFRIIRNEPYHK